jgi:hypothetical protein
MEKKVLTSLYHKNWTLSRATLHKLYNSGIDNPYDWWYNMRGGYFFFKKNFTIDPLTMWRKYVIILGGYFFFF